MATFNPSGRNDSIEGRTFHIHIYNPDGTLRVEGDQRRVNGAVVFDGIVVKPEDLGVQMAGAYKWILEEAGRVGTVYGPECSKITIFSNYKEKLAARGWNLEGYEAKSVAQVEKPPWES